MEFGAFEEMNEIAAVRVGWEWDMSGWKGRWMICGLMVTVIFELRVFFCGFSISSFGRWISSISRAVRYYFVRFEKRCDRLAWEGEDKWFDG